MYRRWKCRKKKAYLSEDVAFVNKLCCFVPNNLIVNRFLYFFILSKDFGDQFVINTTGLSGGVSVSVLRNFNITIPNYTKQLQITDFLDQKTNFINKLTSDKQDLIIRLKEYRQTIINEAVTKGLDKNGSMKDSGVDWIGKVPASWNIYKIRRVFDIVKRPYMLEDRPVLSITQTGIKVKDITKNDGQLAQSYVGYQEVNVGDFAMNGMDLLTGNVDCSIYNGVTSPDYRVFRFKNSSKMNSDYYKYLFQQCYSRRIFYKFGQGVSNLGRWRLQTEVFLDFNIPVPTVDNQAKISNYINSKTNKINSIVNSIEQQIAKLQEYKKAIISEAVAGKIKIEEHISREVI